MPNPTDWRTSVGRLVWGHPMKLTQKRDQKTRQVVMKDGKPVEQVAFGIAYPKVDFIRDSWPNMEAEAATGYPQGVPQRFAWKYDDGDAMDGDGKPFAEREGYAGCYILKFNSSFTVQVVKFNPQTRTYDQLTADQIKPGDYVVAGVSAKCHVSTGPQDTPSLYINPTVIELVGYGTEIVSRGAVDPMAVLGGQQHQLPPGASATPIAGNYGVNAPGMPPQQQPGPMPGQMPGGMQPRPMPGQMPYQPPQQPGYAPQQPGPAMQPGYPPQQQQPGYPPPAHDFVAQAGMQPMPGGMPQGYPPQQPGQMPYQPPQQPGYAPQQPQGYPQPGYPPQQPQPGPMPGQQMPGGYPGQMPQR